VTGLVPAPPASNDRVRAVMRGNRRRDTSPELRVRSRLHAMGLRYRVDHRIECGGRSVRIDIAFPRRRVAVFIDGCFWHGCERHPKASKSNVDYWTPKIAGNRARDAAQTAALEQAGWEVVRGWEHEAPVEIAARVERALSPIKRRDGAQAVAANSGLQGGAPPRPATTRAAPDPPRPR
jgi:DNA mismatch endonuclease (patch repair protein)